MPVQRTHPQPCVQWKKARKQVTTGTPKRRHSLRNGLTAYTCSPWCTGLFSHHRLADHRLRNLIPASGDQDHTILPYEPVALVLRANTSIASRAQRP